MLDPKERLNWLLEADDPGVAYLAERDLLKAGEKALAPLKLRAHREGPINQVLENMQSEGYWVNEGAGYNPKYRSSIWAMILLAQLGASIEVDKRLAAACNYMLEHTLAAGGQFSWKGTSSCTIDCLQGNLCAALLDLGCQDPRLDLAFEWMARSETGEGLKPAGDASTPEHYYFTGKCGPVFACSATQRQPCAWGAVKVMLAFSKYPAKKRNPLIKRAIKTGVDFLFSVDPLSARYPTGSGAKPSGVWWKFGFPLFYGTDLLQLAEALSGLGYADDPRLAGTLAFVRDRQDENGLWALEHHYNGKTWVEFGGGGRPNKWVTLRALKLLGLDTQKGQSGS